MSLRVCRLAEEWREQIAPGQTAAAIGNFDGVHRGHERILARVVEAARTSGLRSAVATFDPHPTRVLRPDSSPPLIMTLAQRLACFDAAGIDAALVLPFTAEFARLSPREFAERVLVDTLHAAELFVGENFRFGHRQEGDVSVLAALGRELGFRTGVVPAVRLRGQVVSSSLVRRAVAEGCVDLAGRMLGRPFALTGAIQPGTGQGSKVVVPTLNLVPEQELLPARGVYATEAIVAGKLYRAATNVGLRPTFAGHVLSIETHLLDFSAEVKSGPLEVRFWRRLRDERKFPSATELRSQVLRDIDSSCRFFTRLDRSRRQRHSLQPVTAVAPPLPDKTSGR